MAENRDHNAADKTVPFNRILQRAHEDAMQAFNQAEPTSPPTGGIAINSLDGRKKFVRRFKRVSDENRYRDYAHPDLPLRLWHDRQQRCYKLEHHIIDGTAIDNSMMQRVAGYNALHERLEAHGYAREGAVGPK